LIRELEKYSDRAGNTRDKEQLRIAAERIEAVVTIVNEATREAEERQRVLSIGSTLEPVNEIDTANGAITQDTYQRWDDDAFYCWWEDKGEICGPFY
jgi:hypothetical protein